MTRHKVRAASNCGAGGTRTRDRGNVSNVVGRGGIRVQVVGRGFGEVLSGLLVAVLRCRTKQGHDLSLVSPGHLVGMASRKTPTRASVCRFVADRS